MLPRPAPKCSHCGAATNLARRLSHVGGRGLVEYWTCRDRAACWRRWAKAVRRCA